VSVLKKRIEFQSCTRASAMMIALAVLAGCAGGRVGSTLPAIPDASSRVHSLALKGSDFKRFAAWGAKGKLAVAQCPQGYKVVAGGSSSSDGSSVGTGYASSNRASWIVKPGSSASGEAFATCVADATFKATFRWHSAPAISGLAAAQCRSGYTLITGYGTGGVTASWFDPSTNTYWVAGNAVAHASCARDSAQITIKHAWNKSQKPKNVYAGCGTGSTAIAGAMGDSAWPGPPIQEHPGLSSGPGTHGYDGWWTFSNALNELTWVACVST
jgi:hypothetical protein